ncbi:MAG TPA: hypothetical protein VGJ05_20880 [Fimbriiglobus sp.]|jgi:hypothetical protein
MSLEPQNRPQTTADKNRPRGRPFTGPDDPRNRTNREAATLAGTVPDPVPVEGEGLLAAMRHVIANDKVHDRTPEQKLARMLLKDQTKFFDRFMALEKADLAARAVAATNACEAEEVDVGAERCERLLDNLLGSIHDELAREDAELAARPDAAKIGATLQNKLNSALERQGQLERQVADLREKVVVLGGNPDYRTDSAEFRAGRPIRADQ